MRDILLRTKVRTERNLPFTLTPFLDLIRAFLDSVELEFVSVSVSNSYPCLKVVKCNIVSRGKLLTPCDKAEGKTIYFTPGVHNTSSPTTCSLKNNYFETEIKFFFNEHFKVSYNGLVSEVSWTLRTFPMLTLTSVIKYMTQINMCGRETK